MKNFKKLSAIVLSTVFATMQMSMAAIDTGLGGGNGGAVINNATGGLVDVTKGLNSADLNFNADTHVNWDTLNVNANETLNFNAVNGATDLTILNTVNEGMTNIYGQVNANKGIGNLIISNPNGMIFDGAKFTTAGELRLTTQDMSGLTPNDLKNLDNLNLKYSKVYDSNGKLIPVQIKNSTFNVSGPYTIHAPYVSAEASKINTNGNFFKIVTANGADYQAVGGTAPANNKGVTFLKSMSIDGDVVIVNEEGAMSIANGGDINGNLYVDTKGNTFVNYSTEGGKRLTVKGDVLSNSHGQWSFVRNADIDGNLTMHNDGGFVDVGDVNVKGNANLKTEGVVPLSSTDYNHYIHVIGDTNIDGNLNIEASQNIHIGGYDYDARQLAEGKLTVGGDLNAHSTNGHITTTIDTTAKNIKLTSDTLNILTDDKAVLKADTYEFSSNGYIGGIKDIKLDNGNVLKKDDQIVNIMENYTFIPKEIKSHAYTNVDGGKITKLNAPNNSEVYISSKNNLEVTGANAHNINLNAPGKRIDITGNNVKANNINVAGDTNYLKVEFPSRNYTLNYTNIRDGVVKTIAPTDEITYGLTDDPDTGYNAPTLQPGEKTTYLIGPGVPPTPPTPPAPPAVPDDNNENARNLMTQWVPDDIMQTPVNTPIAFAADLDDDQEGAPVRKNVDGSVTVVRAFAVGK